jgi:hypothetical protein
MLIANTVFEELVMVASDAHQVMKPRNLVCGIQFFPEGAQIYNHPVLFPIFPPLLQNSRSISQLDRAPETF